MDKSLEDHEQEPQITPTAAKPRRQPRGPSLEREIVEFVVMVVILWIFLKTFEVEPFVIPTGSMAPTLMGRHMDVECEKCGFPYQTNASVENRGKGEVTVTLCPICRYEMILDKAKNRNQESFIGDRILVDKLAYQFSDPDRWDVGVFKYPGDAKMNYIKRIVGLPNESIRIQHGDIWIRKKGQQAFELARRPSDTVVAMLQIVDDSQFVPEDLKKVNWPTRWQPLLSAGDAKSPWVTKDHGESFEVQGPADGVAWLRYHHVAPLREDWRAIGQGVLPQREIDTGALITDFYAYNNRIDSVDGASFDRGRHWVGDLAIETEVEIRDQGELWLEVIEGGWRLQCQIDVSTGKAKLVINGEADGPWGSDGKNRPNPTAATSLTSPGSYNLRFANVDDQLLLWVDNELVEFNTPTTFVRDVHIRPQWSPSDPLDAAPLGIGARGVSLRVNRLRVLRDIYYIAKSNHRDSEYRSRWYDADRTLGNRLAWEQTELFRNRLPAEFELGDNQYFALGDNSPESLDTRIWTTQGAPQYVDRTLLVGKAFMIYWPHTWNRPIPYWPNFKRIGLIR